MTGSNSSDEIDLNTGQIISEADSGQVHGKISVPATKFKREYLEVPVSFLELVGAAQEKEPLFFTDTSGHTFVVDYWPRRRLLGGLGEWYRLNDVTPEDNISIGCENRDDKRFKILIEGRENNGETEGLYLGKEYYMLGGLKKELKSKFIIPESDLLTHVFVCGVTGSGKTVFGKALIEEAALRGIPAVVIDLKGDLSSFAIKFDSVSPEEFAPWMEGKSKNEKYHMAEIEAKKHREKLAEFGIEYKTIKAFSDTVQIRLFTPRSSKGISLAFSSPLAAPNDALDLYSRDREEFNNLAASLTNAFVDRLYPGVKRVKIENERNYLYEIVHHCWLHNIDLSGMDGLFQLLKLCDNPPFTEIGGLPVDQYITAENRKSRLLNKINTMLSGPEAMWFEGNPLSVEGQFLNAKEGTTPINIVNLTEIDSFEDRSFVVAQIGYEIYKWMKKQPGTSRPRLLFFIDEIGGGGGKQAFFPSFPYECAAKWALNYLLRQGRAYGVCCSFATQNPGDIDYRALSNCGTWIAGKLATDRDRKKVLEGMEIWGSELERVKRNLANADIGDFVVKDVRGQVHYVKERWLMTYHRVLTMQEVQRITQGKTSPKPPETSPPNGGDDPGKDAGPGPKPGSRSITDLIAGGENESVEFKQSARWNLKKEARDENLELAIVRTVAGFMNSGGGTLLIGVDDRGQIVGLDYDFRLFTKADRTRDKYGLWMMTLLKNCIGKAQTSANVKILFEAVDGKDICRIDTPPANRAVYVNTPGTPEDADFYVRMGASTQKLIGRELEDYLRSHWG
ncbi:MAG: DUF853 family protein [Blastocatellia bacterium]|nr:DUF853 family protein [Blastocatellia bacterium]